jgi:hypothetical protein
MEVVVVLGEEEMVETVHKFYHSNQLGEKVEEVEGVTKEEAKKVLAMGEEEKEGMPHKFYRNKM